MFWGPNVTLMWLWWNFNQFCYWYNSAEVIPFLTTTEMLPAATPPYQFKCFIDRFVSPQPALPPDQDSVAGLMDTSLRAKNWSSTWGRLKPKKANKCTSLFDTTIKENTTTQHVTAVLILYNRVQLSCKSKLFYFC